MFYCLHPRFLPVVSLETASANKKTTTLRSTNDFYYSKLLVYYPNLLQSSLINSYSITIIPLDCEVLKLYVRWFLRIVYMIDFEKTTPLIDLNTYVIPRPCNLTDFNQKNMQCQSWDENEKTLH